MGLSMGIEPTQREVAVDYREQAIQMLEACDPGDCGCGEPHTLPEGEEDLIDQMVALLEETTNKEGE